MVSKLTLRINAGEHTRHECPVRLPLPENLPAGPLWLERDGTAARLPAQRVGDQLLVVLDRLSRGESALYHLASGDEAPGGVRVTESNERLDVAIDGAAFTSYHVAASGVRPYFYPLLGPGGVAMTRSYPMLKDVAGESRDHPHHRSLYVAFGEVNGVNVWAEGSEGGVGRIVHRGWDGLVDGPAGADLRESLQWVDAQDFPLLDERRHVAVYRTSSVRLLDVEIVLTPSRFGVLFGDTKEGGPLALRINSALEGKHGGLIENAYGGRREAETWGKRSPWVDYSGALDGSVVGVAIMDHPTSFRHPTYWHVRDYGLFAANPFGISAFTGDPAQRGEVVLIPGQTLTFRYRVCLHRGDAAAGEVAEHYHDFANPPLATWIQ